MDNMVCQLRIIEYKKLRTPIIWYKNSMYIYIYYIRYVRYPLVIEQIYGNNHVYVIDKNDKTSIN